METIEYLGKILNPISIFIASIVAILGISKWRRETKWQKRYLLAEEVLTLIYEAEEAFKTLRNPWNHPEEGKSKLTDSPADKERKFLSYYILLERYDKCQEPFIKLRSLKYRFMAIYGKEHEELFKRHTTLLNELFASAVSLDKTYWPNQGVKQWANDGQFQKHLDEMHRHEDIIWGLGENDIFGQKITDVTKAFELTCGKIIKEHWKDIF